MVLLFLSSTQSSKRLGEAASFFLHYYKSWTSRMVELLFFDSLTTLNIGPSCSERLLPRPTNGVTVEGDQDLPSHLEVCSNSSLYFQVAVHVQSLFCLFCGDTSWLALRSVHDRAT